MIISIFLFITTMLFMGISWYYRNENKNKTTIIKQMKVQKKILNEKHKIKLFENNQTIIFKKEKEVKDEEVDSTVGTHTIIFN
ncbi:hypothetical protein [Caminibacter sp.]